MPRPRRSQKRARPKASTLKSEFDHAIQLSGGTNRTLDLLRSASKEDIQGLPEDYGPLAGPILIAGSTYTRRIGSRIPQSLIPTLKEVMEVAKARGISVDGGSVWGEHWRRPLVEAAYYGFLPLVEHLLDLGAHPDKADGEGRTALHSALQNPAGQPHVLRDCDRAFADLLGEKNLVTSNLRVWRNATPGSVIYINSDCTDGSALLSAIRNKSIEAVKWLVSHGAVLTDRDFLILYQKRHGQNLLLQAVKKATTAETDNEIKTLNCWSPDIDWSFPPTWKNAVQLTKFCGLPQEIFKDHVLPFCSREWFYTPDQLNGVTPVPARLGASLGSQNRNMLARAVRWKGDD